MTGVTLTEHAVLRFEQRIGRVGTIEDAWAEGVDLPDWLGRLLFKRGRSSEGVRYRWAPALGAVLVWAPVPHPVIVTVLRPRPAHIIALRRSRVAA
jgi:hypothetical protein